MKIHHVPMGARFVYEGEEYVKSGPMMAAGKAGQRLIPKYAVLQPVDDVTAAPAAKSIETLAREDVLLAFEAFYARCAALVAVEKRGELEAGRTEFLKMLS